MLRLNLPVIKYLKCHVCKFQIITKFYVVEIFKELRGRKV